MSGRPVVGTVGSREIRMAARQRSVLRPEMEGAPRALDAKLVFGDDPARESYSSTKWFLNPGQRVIMILTLEEEEGERSRIRVRALKL